jgi:hypothetical protein
MSCTFNPRDFTVRLVSAVNIATAYREHVKRVERREQSLENYLKSYFERRTSPDVPAVVKDTEERKASSIDSNE